MTDKNRFTATVTQGDPYRGVFAFTDANGAAQDLTGWDFSMSWKYAYDDDETLFDCDSAGEIGFVGDDPESGEVFVALTAIQTAAVAVTMTVRSGQAVPSRNIVGDLKITPPDGTVLEMAEEARPQVVLTVYGRITA